MHGRDAAQLAGLVVGEGLHDLLTGIHHKRTGPGDWLTGRMAAEDEHVQRRTAALLRPRGRDRERIPGTQDRELTHAGRNLLCTHCSGAGHHVHKRVVVGAPWH